MSILIFSSQEDIHARAIAWGLNRSGIQAHIAGTSNFPSNQTLMIELDDARNSNLELVSTTGAMIPFATIQCIWRRRALLDASYCDFSAVHEDDLTNIVYETQGFLNNYWLEIKDLFDGKVAWVNDLRAAGRASNKVQQLKMARSVGLTIPHTIVGNAPERIRQFFAENDGEIIFKPFFQHLWRDGAQVHRQTTFEVPASSLLDDGALQVCPGIYQRHIKKRYELRVLVLGDILIAAKLDSQVNSETKIDWRLDSHKMNMPIEPYTLVAPDQEKILEFMKRLNLRFGSIDLIVTPDDELVFLEINEQGQFLFLDERCPELCVMQAVCRFLADEAGMLSNKPGMSFPSFAEYRESDDGIAQRKDFAAFWRDSNNSGIRFAFEN